MKKLFTLLIATTLIQHTYSQSGKLDSLFASGDTTAIMDSLLKDFDSYLDSLTKPKNFFSVSVGAGTGVFSFQDKSSVNFNTEKKLIISPMIGYFNKTGFGISATAFAMNDDNKINFYQYAFSPSFDHIRRSVSTGISYTRYIEKDSLSFYTTPIQNELFAYFTYKKWWVRPSVNVAFGWGSKADYEKKKFERLARLLARRNRYYVVVKNEESIHDLSVTASVRKDFDWYGVFGKKDNITFTPVLMLNSGTQTFGFNTSYSYNFTPVRANFLPSNQEISDNTRFALQSASLVLRGSYLSGKFLLQSQVLFDYYLLDLADESTKLNTVFSLTAGISF